MKWIILACVASSAFAETTLLLEAEAISQRYSGEIAKAPPPSSKPQIEALLELAPCWFTLDLERSDGGLATLSQPGALDALKEIGVRGVFLEHLKRRDSFSIDPKWGSEKWVPLILEAEGQRMALIGEGLGNSTGLGKDFELALQNKGDYPSLYHLIEIAPEDWKILPSPLSSQVAVNIPWLTLQSLYKMGYVPEKFSSYIKESEWNATGKVPCADGKVRRWIYLKEGQGDPVLSWLSPSFSANRISAADAMHSLIHLGQKILIVDGKLPPFAKETLALWIRKIGGFSVENVEGGLQALKESPCDAAMDIWTRPALLHALLAEDSEALRIIYQLFLDEGIDAKRLVHTLQPFDRFVCDWAIFLDFPKKHFSYWEERTTSELLRKQLLRDDLYRLGAQETEALPLSTWAGYCAVALGIKEVEKQSHKIQQAHLLLALSYAMQPGIFSFSEADLLGALPLGAKKLDLFGKNPDTLYPSLGVQMKNPSSFASELKRYLQVRRENDLAKAELIAVLPPKNRGCLLLFEKHPKTGQNILIALNFSRQKIQETLQNPSFRSSTAIELLTGLAEAKPFDSAQISFELSPLSGKVILFQKRTYD